MNTYEEIVDSGRVIPDDPNGSLLVLRIRDGSMPPGRPLSAQELAVIEDWILNGALSESGQAPLTGPDSIAPVASAGVDLTITLPASSFSLFGNGRDEDGVVMSYQWVQISGPNAPMSGASSAVLTVNNPIAGVYEFQLIVTDNDNLTHSDGVRVTVVAAPNINPVANAGTDLSIVAPTNMAQLIGSGTDSDGIISSYLWTQISGPSNAILATPNTANTQVNGLLVGTYVFRLRVTDNRGGTAEDLVSVLVNPANVIAPMVNAGTDLSIQSPASTSQLTGTATPGAGSTIQSVRWTQVSGPNTATIATSTAVQTNLSGLVVGVYVFQLSATSNQGATSVDSVQLTVVAGANVAPMANAGPDQTINLPTATANLSGSGTDSDGTIASYQWSQVSGPNTAVINGATSATATVGGLVAGTYVMRLTVTDNRGATANDTVSINVVAATNPNATYTWIAANVLTPRCLNCHGPTRRDGGVDFRTYTSTIRTLTAGNAARSPLYTEVASGSMPEGGTRLTTVQVQAIQDWINAGALNN